MAEGHEGTNTERHLAKLVEAEVEFSYGWSNHIVWKLRDMVVREDQNSQAR